MCVTVPNFVPIGQTVAEILPFFDFSRCRFTILSAGQVRKANMSHFAEFRATLSHHHMDLHAWSNPRHSHIFHVLSKSVQGFRSPKESKFVISHHYFGYWLYNSWYTTIPAVITLLHTQLYFTKLKQIK